MDRRNGILPRCLFLDLKDADLQQKGCAIVGINPGRSDEEEKNFYLQRGQTYQQTVAFWKEHKIRYYDRLRVFARGIGLKGPILWTELVKCENLPSIKKPPIQTFRICTHTFLSKELEYLHENWPLIGVGKESFKALSFLYPTRAILGIPHPTGSYGQFSEIQKGHSKLSLNNLLDMLWDGEVGKALWLDAQ